MVMKNAMNHEHSRGACFSRDIASDLRLEKVSAPRRVDSTRSPSRPAMTAFCAQLPFPTTDFETGHAVKPHLIGLPNARPVERPRQRARFGDLRHFRRRRKAFERW